MNKFFRIAIDGPSGAGKSTIAKKVAKELNIDYIDTGAMYRTVGYKMVSEGISVTDEVALAKMLADTDIDFCNGNVVLDGRIITNEIRTAEMSAMASACSAVGIVRTKLVELQKKMAHSKSVIMDGRDIGTNVIKDAEYKFFLTADPEERAKRRFKEMQEKGNCSTYEQVLADIIQRDKNDTTRALNPLAKAEDAIELDTTYMDIDQVVEYILNRVNSTMNPARE